MTKALLAAVAISLPSIAGSAIAADLPINAPWRTPGPAFSWTSCYFGAHLGGGWARKDITDPVQLVQDTLIAPGTTTGVTTVGVNPDGILVGGQLGCDYQFAPHWVIGIEGSASGSTMRGSTTVGLPASPGDQAIVNAGTDFIPSITARFGYAFDRVLLYAKGGAAWAGDKYSVTGGLTGIGPFDFEGLDLRPGWTVGGGVDWAFAGHWSVNVEYDYYSFGQGTVLMTDSVSTSTGFVNVKQSVQVLKAGLNFHMWSW